MAVKRFYFFGSYSSFRPFIMEVESGNDGVFIIPTTGGGYNYSVKTSDGQAFSGVTGNLTITFPSANTRYDIEITGYFPRIYFNDNTQRLKIKDIKQWGDIVWSSFANAFYGCENLVVSAADAPNLSNVTTMERMFRACKSLTGSNGNWNWDTSNITNMSETFNGANSFNGDISNWDTSNVTTMFRMFMSAGKFNRNLSSWDMTSVTDASEMFRDYSYPDIMEFNNGGQPLMWKFNKTVNMSNWFLNNKSSLNIDITFDFIDAPIGVNLTSLFQAASNMNSQVNILGSSVTNMSYMFYQCTSLTTLDVSTWDVSSVTNMSYMFYQCTSLTTLDVSTWDVSSVTNMSYMFYQCTSLTTLDVSAWDVSSVTNMSYMFYQCTSLTTLDVSNWDVSSVTNMQTMFYQCTSLTTLDVSNWDVSSVTNMQTMFQQCTSLTTLDVSAWDVSSVTNMDRMFQFCTNFISDIDFSDPITGSISLTEIRGMMAGTKSERLLLQAGNLQSPANIAGNPSNWIASPNMKEVKLFGMKNDVDTTIGFGSAGAMTGEAWLDLLESFDITQASTYRLSATAYNNMEAHLQSLGYIDIQDYLTQTSNNWTVIF